LASFFARRALEHASAGWALNYSAGAAIASSIPEVLMWKYLIAIPALIFTGHISANAAEIPTGTQIQVRSDAPIEVARWDRGRIYPGHVAQDVLRRGGELVIQRGSPVELMIRQVAPGELELDMESVTTTNGSRYVLDTTGPDYNMSQAQFNSGSGVLGTIAGATAGTNGEQVVTQGNHVFVPGGTLVTFTLEEPLHVARWNEPGSYRNGEWYHSLSEWYR
jgi:hypothetical protein